MEFRNQTIFDRRKPNKDKISDVIKIEKFDMASYIRKAKLTDDIEISVPENFVAVIPDDCGIHFSLDMFTLPINYFDNGNIDIKFINLNPKVINISNEELKIVEHGLDYCRDFDDFLIGHCMYTDIKIINNKIDSLTYTFMYETEYGYLGGCDYWIWEDGIYCE